MGWRAAEDLAANGIKACVLESESTPEGAVQQFLSGELKAAGSFCRCHH
jgi:predicted Fe-Mo cluster-binding NifX family protein